jgi:hypothetical protein
MESPRVLLADDLPENVRDGNTASRTHVAELVFARTRLTYRHRLLNRCSLIQVKRQ